MKKILIVYMDMSAGGSTTSLISMLNMFDFSKYEVDLALFDRGKGFEEYIPPKVNILHEMRKYDGTKCGLIKKGFIYFLSFTWILKIINTMRYGREKGNEITNLYFRTYFNTKNIKKKYDVAIGYLEGWPDCFICKKVNALKKIAWIHTDLLHQENVNKNYVKFYLGDCNKVVCVSESVLHGFKKILPEYSDRAIYLPNIMSSKYIRERANNMPDDIENYNMIKEYNYPKIISVCRYSIRVKGIDRMLNAAAKLKERGIIFNWYLIGDGMEKDRKWLEQEIQKKGISDCFFPIGGKINPYPYMKECDILAQPSRVEGKPVVVTEALMLGLVPIVTEYMSASEQIQNGENGFIVNNSTEAFIEKMINILSDFKTVKQIKRRNYLIDYSNIADIRKIENNL